MRIGVSKATWIREFWRDVGRLKPVHARFSRGLLCLSAPFRKYGIVSRRLRSLTVAALIGAARLSKRLRNTSP